MFDPTNRILWDKSLKDIKVIDKLNNESYLCHTWSKSPMVLVSERDFIDKKIEFYHKGTYFLFSTAVENTFLPENQKDKVIRCFSYYNIQTIHEEGDFFVYTTSGQADVKIPIPDSWLNFTLPGMFHSWFESVEKEINKK